MSESRSPSLHTLRPHQERIIAYAGGRMGVSAVPGSGKTWTLSRLAAEIIHNGRLGDDQEVLVVTLVNSAVDNFYARVRWFLLDWGLLPNIGYRVRTLHGLAHDIVRERPSLVGLDARFTILDEREAEAILSDVSRTWLRANPHFLDDYFNSEVEENKRESLRQRDLPDLVIEMAKSFIRTAKDAQLTPEDIQRRLDQLPVPLPLAEMSCSIYTDYQRSLNYRGGVDFDDLIRLALKALQTDPKYLERLQDTWPYILEDEAQDSSQLQEKILRTLAGSNGNWIRVGDPNQAIYETFTTANPKYLWDFLRQEDVADRHLPTSGRSSEYIIELANQLVHWTQASHPNDPVRSALYGPPFILPTEPGDPQPNPEGSPENIILYDKKLSPDEEIRLVADSLGRWLSEHPNETVAVLAPRNTRAFELIAALEQRGIPYEDGLLSSSRSTRASASVLRDILTFLAEPKAASKLSNAYKAWRHEDQADRATRKIIQAYAERLRRIERVEDFLWPGPDGDCLAELEFTEPEIYEELNSFRELLRRWQRAILLPVDGLLLTLAHDLLSEPAELALAHKLAVLLRRVADTNPEWRLPELIQELALIADNQRRYLGFDNVDTGFDPDQHKGRVVVSTMHKAKGLEWDRVYLMSVSSYDFPSGVVGEAYIPEKWWIRDNLNLPAETLAQLDTLHSMDEYEWYKEGQATQAARYDYARERLRLLYVGITRARRELIVTWNTGKSKKGPTHMAAPFLALKQYWDEKYPRQAKPAGSAAE